MKHYKKEYCTLAKERLRLMFEAEPFSGGTVPATRMKKEIFEILERYYDFSQEDYDIKIVIRPRQ